MPEPRPRRDKQKSSTPPDPNPNSALRRKEWELDSTLAIERIDKQLQRLVGDFFSDPETMDDATRSVTLERTDAATQIRSDGRSQKKTVGPWHSEHHGWYMQGQQDLRTAVEHATQAGEHEAAAWIGRGLNYPLLTPWELEIRNSQRESKHQKRMNEDVIGVGNGWHVLCDGAGYHGNGVARVMAEAVRRVAEERLKIMRAYEDVLMEQEIQSTLQGIVQDARRLQPILGRNKKAKERFQSGELTGTDFSTTAEILYYSRRYAKTFLLHVGDSRTYAVVPVAGAEPRVQQLTVDHEDHNVPSGLTSAINLSNPSPTVDIIGVSVVPGMRLVSVSDGVFNAYERLHPTQSFETILQREAGRPQAEMVEALQKFALQEQIAASYFDDTSCVSTMLTVSGQKKLP